MSKRILHQQYVKLKQVKETCCGQRLYCWPPRAKEMETLGKNLNVSALLYGDGGDGFSKNALKAYKIKNAVVDRPLFPPEELHKIVALATCPPQETQRPINRWTISDLTEEIIQQNITQISRSSVWRFLDQLVLKPHRWVYWLNSPDSNFEPKMLHIVDLYLRPPADGLLFSLDEKTGIQALERKYPDQPSQPGQPYRREHSYQRHGTQDLLAAFEISSGNIFAKTFDGHSSVYWEGFIKELVSQYPEGQKFHFIQDNYSTHSTPQLCQLIARLCHVPLPELKTQEDRRRWLRQENKRIVFHYLPTHASWLNQIEIWFSMFSRKLLKRLNVSSLQELKDKISQFIEYYNDKLAHPYQWTYTGKPLAV